MTRHRLTIALILSLGVHAICLILLSRSPTPDQSATAPFVVEAYSEKRSESPRGTRAKKLALGVWGPGQGKGVAMGIYRIDPNGFFEGGRGKVTDESGGDAEGQIRAVGKLTELYDRINQTLDYPEEFTERGIEGEVRVQLSFDKEGRYLPQESPATAADKYLRVHVRRLLRRALAEPVNSLRSHDGKTSLFICVFQFQILTRFQTGQWVRDEKRSAHAIQFQEDATFFKDKIFLSRGRLIFYRTYNPNQILQVYSAPLNLRAKSGSDSAAEPRRFGVGMDFFPIIKTVFEKLGLASSKKPSSALEKYRQDPDF